MKNLTNAAVSAVLRLCHIPKAETHTTRIRGYHTTSPGYQLPKKHEQREGEIILRWNPGSDVSRDMKGRAADRDGGLSRCAVALDPHFNTERFVDQHGIAALRVTRRS